MGGRNVSRQAAVLVAFVTILGMAGCSGQRYVSDTDRVQARQSFEVATEHINKGEFAQALTTLQQVNGLDPNVPIYHNALGVVFLQLLRPDLALPEFKRAVELDQDYAEGHLNLGIALAEQRQWGDAVTSYRRAIKSPRLVSPDTAYQNLGLALYHLQRYAEAEQALRFAIGLDPQMAAAYYNLGLVLLAENRKSEARTAFQRTRDLAPNSAFGQAATDRLKALEDGG
jgi:Tfp pilus assembly protein PilF